jgi:hypothetical protein
VATFQCTSKQTLIAALCQLLHCSGYRQTVDSTAEESPECRMEEEKQKKLRYLPSHITQDQWLASYFGKVTALLYFVTSKLVTLNPLPIFPCNGSVTVTSYCFFKSNEIVTSYNKK